MTARIWYWLLKAFCAAIVGTAFGFRSAGHEHIPKQGPVLVLSNHQSQLDPVLVGVASPRKLRFLARQSLFHWPLSWLIRSLGAIPLDREGTGLAGLRATLGTLRNGEAILLFPEGTRTSDGRIQPLKGGFAAVARRAEATIVPVGIAGAFDSLPRSRRIPRLRSIRLQFGAAISPAEILRASDEELISLVSDRIAAAQRQANSALGRVAE